MTELELFDRLNPRRDLPQAACDVISQVWKVMNSEVELLSKHVLELQADKGRLIDEIKELEKDLIENKSDCEMCYKKDREKLEKAKEIIREYYEMYSKDYDPAEDEELLLRKAEAFLQEQDK